MRSPESPTREPNLALQTPQALALLTNEILAPAAEALRIRDEGMPYGVAVMPLKSVEGEAAELKFAKTAVGFSTIYKVIFSTERVDPITLGVLSDATKADLLLRAGRHRSTLLFDEQTKLYCYTDTTLSISEARWGESALVRETDSGYIIDDGEGVLQVALLKDRGSTVHFEGVSHEECHGIVAGLFEEELLSAPQITDFMTQLRASC